MRGAGRCAISPSNAAGSNDSLTLLAVYFQFQHEFDISLDALELAVMSPVLSDRFRLHLPRMDMLEQTEHVLENAELKRTWLFRPGLALPKAAAQFGTLVKGFSLTDSWTVTEQSLYGLRRHARTWQLSFSRGEGHAHRRFGDGEYGLYPLGRGRSRRIASGNIRLGVRGVGRAFESYLVTMVSSLYDAEAQSLRELVSLV